MLSVKTTFNERVNEVEIYFSFLENHIDTNPNEDLNKILKSNLLIMLYNLVESTISNSIEEIHNNIHSNSVSFNALKFELKTLLIKHLKNHVNPSDFVSSINDIAIDTIKKCFHKSKISSGNIDSRKIKEMGDRYGFNSNTDYVKTKNGQCLVIIKDRRNDLAHGTFSFTEVGKEYGISDLDTIKKESIQYLTEIVDNIETYLTNQEYKEPVIRVAAV